MNRYKEEYIGINTLAIIDTEDKDVDLSIVKPIKRLNEQDEIIKELEEENRELRLKTCCKDWKDFEKIIDKDIKIQELEDKIIELTAKLNIEQHEPVYCELADRDCKALGKTKELNKELAKKDIEIKALQIDIKDLIINWVKDLEQAKKEWENEENI